jgi:hypothetical protein
MSILLFKTQRYNGRALHSYTSTLRLVCVSQNREVLKILIVQFVMGHPLLERLETEVGSPCSLRGPRDLSIQFWAINFC